MLNWFENHQYTNHRGHKFPPRQTFLSFKTRIKLPLVLTATARKSNRILSTPAISKLVGSQGNIQACRLTRQYPSLSAHKAISKLVGSQGNIQACRLTRLLWWQKPTWFFRHFFFKICRFRSAVLSFHARSHLSQVWQWPALLRIVTNETALFCVDNRLRQMAFLVLPKVGNWEGL